MAYKDFVVKNGLVVNTNFVTNSSAIYFGNSTVNATINSTSLRMGNNASNAVVNSSTLSVGTTDANARINTTSIFVGNSIANIIANGTYLSLSSNVVINTTAIAIGNATVNAWLSSNGLYVNGLDFPRGAGYYKGNLGTVGNTTNAGNLFRINSNTMTANVTIAAGENALTVGPITVNTGVTFAIQTGGRAVIA